MLTRRLSTQVIQEQAKAYDLFDHIDLITFVTDRGSNFICALRQFKVLYCVAHRLNNVLKRTFYQQSKRTREKPAPNKTVSKVIVETETTPLKEIRKTTTMTSMQSSPEFDLPQYSAPSDDRCDSDSTDTTSDDDDDHQCTFIDYSMTTLGNLPSSAKHVLQTIKDCKALVTYVKKVNDLA